jgi:hypothetical protein
MLYVFLSITYFCAKIDSMNKKCFTFLLFLVLNFSVFSQTNRFYEISDKIENLLKYKEKSPSQLRSLLSELKNNSSSNESAYKQVQKRVNEYLLPIEIKLARSDVYNKKYKDAVVKMRELKVNYPYERNIERLEGYIDRKIYSYHKRNMMNQKSSWFTLEPSISMYTSEVRIGDFQGVSNLNPTYGLGMYVKFNKRKKYSSSSKPNFAFSQIGVKLDYRDTTYTLMRDTSFISMNPYINYQLSFLYRKTLGLDAGLVSYISNSANIKNNYSLTGSFYIPMKFLSLGINARMITDFKSSKPLFQLGGTLKFNFGLYKPFSRRDREEVKSQVFKFKEGR